MLLNKIFYLLHASSYVFKIRILRRENPFIGGLIVNDRCNLACEHCRVGSKIGKDVSYEQILDGMKLFHQKGIRSLFLVGGEPCIWKDDEKNLDDIVQMARKIGFKTVTIYTNGTLPIQTDADIVFVSLDGLREVNNKLRGETFDKVIQNISQSRHPNININATINSRNEHQLESFCEYINQINNINGIFFYFHTPYYGMDELFLDIDQKRKIILRILKLKKKYRILNSTACLNMVYKDKWRRPTQYCCVWDKGKLFKCCRAIGNAEVCKNCGYLGYPELEAIMHLYPSALVNALNYLPVIRKQ
jgi:Fe-coproporphyrin III synthase